MAKTMKFELEQLQKPLKSTNCWLPFVDLLSLQKAHRVKHLTALNSKHLQLTPYTKHGYYTVYILNPNNQVIHQKALKNSRKYYN